MFISLSSKWHPKGRSPGWYRSSVTIRDLGRLLLTGGPHPQHVPPTRDPRRLHQEEEAKKELPLLKGHSLEFTCITSAYTPPTRTQPRGPWEIGSFLSRGSITTAEGEGGCWGSTGLSATFHKHLSSAYSFVFCIFLLFFWWTLYHIIKYSSKFFIFNGCLIVHNMHIALLTDPVPCYLILGCFALINKPLLWLKLVGGRAPKLSSVPCGYPPKTFGWGVRVVSALKADLWAWVCFYPQKWSFLATAVSRCSHCKGSHRSGQSQVGSSAQGRGAGMGDGWE